MLLGCGGVLGRIADGRANGIADSSGHGSTEPLGMTATGPLGMTHLAAAMVLLLAAGFVLHSRTGVETDVPRKAFAEFPLELEGWVGRDLKMDQQVLDLLKLTDYTMRAYVPPSLSSAPAGAYEGQLRQAAAPVWLYVGYYSSQRTGSTYHSPKNCLPGGGWTFKTTEQVTGVVPGEPAAAINRVVIEKGFDKQLILYWYQDRGRVVASEYDAKAYLIWDAMTKNRTDGAMVRISTPIVGSEEEAYKHALAFLQASWPSLREHLPN
jgi:EpsI family protein